MTVWDDWQCVMDVLRRIWRHKVPLAFMLGAAGLLVSAAGGAVWGVDGLLSSRGSVLLAGAYLVLGAIYEWTLIAEERREYPKID